MEGRGWWRVEGGGWRAKEGVGERKVGMGRREEGGGGKGEVCGWRYLGRHRPSTERSHAGSIWAKAALMWARTTCV